MVTFVLVHGGWGGGWEWEEVARGLRARGHEVHTPTLTGLGERAHLARPDVGLATHVEDVAATITTLAAERGDGWLVPLPFDGTMGLPDDVATWYIPRLVPQPLATLDDPAHLPRGSGRDVPRHFVRFLETSEEDPADPIAGSSARARERGWDHRELIAPHDLHVSDPDRMVGLLDALAA